MAGKRLRKAWQLVDRDKLYTLDEGISLLKQFPTAKFDETVEVAVRLGVDPRKAEENVRGMVSLPHGTGKTVRVAVFCKGDAAKEAQAAGADFVGAEDLVDRVKDGWTDFDAAIATPDMMGLVGRIGKILGPRGLMPNPKLGTVTKDVGQAVEAMKSGRVEYRVEKAGIVHVGVGKVSFGEDQLKENVAALLEAVVRAKPKAAKGIYLQTMNLSTTMGPGIKLDPVPFRNM
ncbi:MAG: 50S ribosomal protein L1 [bacterium]|nr:50S ribosomal protein L1 [bacterium]